VGSLKYRLKVDFKGRILLPREIRDELGDIVVIEKTDDSFILKRGELIDFLKEFKRIITSEPPRTGRPENWSPSKMKKI